MSELYIHSPQPTRPLKRKACQLYSPEDTIEPDQKKLHLEHEGCAAEPHCNRPALYNTNPYPNHPTFDGVRSWLARVPSPLDRRFTRSDSYLFANMPSRTTNSARVADRPATAKPVMQVPLTQAMLPPSPCLTQTRHVSLTPSQSIPPASQVTRRTKSSGSEGSKTLTGVHHPCYRNDLWFHSVTFDPLSLSIPSSLRDYAQQILERDRTSPEFDDAQIVSMWQDIEQLMNSDEDATREGLRDTALFPKKKDFRNLAVGGNLLFDRTGLPQIEGFKINPIVAPKPDLHYGYAHFGFDVKEYQTMLHNRLAPFARPTTASYWPFFAVEFKSASRGGTHWVAENQNSGTGSHCVKSMEKLLSYSRPAEQREIKDSLAFTCTVDVNSAAIWVHWCDAFNAKPMFISSKINSYLFLKRDDLQAFRKSVRNILDYGLGERLSTIKEALSEAYLMIPQWDAEDKSKRSRKASQMESEYDADLIRWGQESEE